LKQKEELAEGLHLIDFEQLKIENQSLNEKIEERNEELLKLRKKTTTTVQILTHVREKLQFVERENAQLQTQLEELERDLSERRDRLGKAKSGRDTLRLQGRKIKEASVYITNSTLLDDMEVQREKREQLLMAIDDCKIEYSQLAEAIGRNQTRILATTEEMALQGSSTAIKALRTLKSTTSVKSGKSQIHQRVGSQHL
jgi:molybdopterin converting factor small subunit